MLLVALALVTAGCGGSSSSASSSGSASTTGASAEQTQLLSKLSTQLQNGSLNAPDLTACVVARAKTLPIATLRKLADAGATLDPASKQTAQRITNACIAEGHGASAVRALIASSVRSSLSPTLPPSYADCVARKANGIPASRLAHLMASAEQNAATGHAEAEQVGIDLGKQCLGDPAVSRVIRAKFLEPIKRAFQTSRYSVAFRNCVLRKAEAITTAQLQQMVAQPTKAQALGEALGRRWAQACVASGAKP